MSDLLSYLDFVMNIVCVMPPVDKIGDTILTRNQAIIIAMCTVGFLVVAVTASTMKEALPKHSPISVIAIAACIAGLGFIGMGQETFKGLFLTFYPPMVISLRLLEGFVVGEKISEIFRWWHGVLSLSVILGFYFLFNTLSTGVIVAIKGGWATFGIIWASFLWMRKMADAPLFKSPFCMIGMFAVFASTLAYVSASTFEKSIFQWCLPVGLILGAVVHRTSHRISD